MILVDTSVWVDHLREGDDVLAAALEAGLVLVHPFVIGELSLGLLKNREALLSALNGLPTATLASGEEVLTFIERHSLAGAGIGYVDAHLMASVRLTAHASLWTRDRRLALVAERLGLKVGAESKHR